MDRIIGRKLGLMRLSFVDQIPEIHHLNFNYGSGFKVFGKLSKL